MNKTTPPPPESQKASAFLHKLRAAIPAAADYIERELRRPPAAPAAPAAPRSGIAAPSARRAPAQHKRARAAAKLTQAARRAQRERDRDDRILDKLHRTISDAGGTIQRQDLTRIPSAVWRMTAQVIADQTGRAARIYLARMSARASAGAILRAALENGQAWADLRARRIAALGLALDALGRRTRRRGLWTRVVMGITRAAFCALLRNPFDPRERARPSVSACFGVHRPGAAEDTASNAIGYFRALARAGAAYCQQLPTSQAAACERGYPSGHLPNRYWLLAEPWELQSDEHAERFAQLHRAANADCDELDADDRARRAPPPASASPPA
jgi:hypothetical protein